MLHFVMRQVKSNETPDPHPIALLRINATVRGDMTIGFPRPSRFGLLSPVSRDGRLVYHLRIGDNPLVEQALTPPGIRKYSSGLLFGDWEPPYLEEVTRAEWESWAEMELFPVLRTALAK
jgi:hypothetical protein